MVTLPFLSDRAYPTKFEIILIKETKMYDCQWQLHVGGPTIEKNYMRETCPPEVGALRRFDLQAPGVIAWPIRGLLKGFRKSDRSTLCRIEPP
jgi:hypothetical protein